MSGGSDDITIESFPQKISSAEAEEILRNSDEEIETTWIRRVLYYPYEVFTFQAYIPMLLHTNEETVYCGVDLVSGNELLIDNDPAYETKTTSSNHVLPREQDHEATIKTARTFVRDLVNQQLKPLRTPTIECVARQLLHRLFYVVVIETAHENTLQYAVDSVSSNYHRVYLSIEDDDPNT